MQAAAPRRAFTEDDQAAFAALSGDRNPIHVDAVAARRTLAGRPVVHGVHTLVWALDALAAGAERLPVPASLRADFTSFLFVGQSVALGPLSSGEARRATVTEGGRVVMRLELRDRAPARATAAIPRHPPLAAIPEAIELDVADLEGRSGTLLFATEGGAVADRFPAACAWLGTARIQALLGCTRLVGMVCPGLHSVFNRLDATLQPPDDRAADRLDWAVASFDARFARVTLAVSAPGLAATLAASVRPPPVRQASAAAVARAVDGQRFAGARALVVGGSRGLGELTAKVLAAGGAEVVLTYARGQADAERVAGEITDQGGRCAALSFDVTAATAHAVSALCTGITHAYYFATPPIVGAAAPSLDPERFALFCSFYVQGFAMLCDGLRSAGSTGVFYPSTVFLDDPARRDMLEYRMAKAAGEVLCEAVARSGLRVVRSRLPMLATDQTAALQPPDALATLLPLIVEVQGGATP